MSRGGKETVWERVARARKVDGTDHICPRGSKENQYPVMKTET